MSRIVRFPVPRDRTVDAPPLVPIVPTRGRIPDSIDRILSDLAADPDASTPTVRNALFTAYWPLLSRISRKVWWTTARRGYVELEDVQQEAFLTFTALLSSWSGEGSFSRFLLGRFHWRLRDHVRQLNGREITGEPSQALGTETDDSYQSERALALLTEIVDDMSPFDHQLAILRVRDGRSFGQIASDLGVSRSTVETRWKVVRIDLYRNLQLFINNFD